MQTSSREREATTPSQVQGVSATSAGLFKATLGAAVAAGAILTFVWLPAEYGIDPTGAGHMLGLTDMGHIKEQLHHEADADTAATLAAQSAQPELANQEVLQKLDAIQAQLAAIAAAVESGQIVTQTSAAPHTDAALEPEAWRDEVEYTLVPGQGIEVKLAMNEGAIAEFEWSANGAVVNHDTHGDGNGESISYEKGRSVPEQAGQLVAAFTGNHGWFWRNRTEGNVDITLRTRGDYIELVEP
ncbi:MAG: transmembrane anchor protein [Granulosicoccus sp.]